MMKSWECYPPHTKLFTDQKKAVKINVFLVLSVSKILLHHHLVYKTDQAYKLLDRMHYIQFSVFL